MVGAKLEDRLRIRRGLKAVVSAGVMRANTRTGQVSCAHLLHVVHNSLWHIAVWFCPSGIFEFCH